MAWWRPWRLLPDPSRAAQLHPAISRAEGLKQQQQLLDSLTAAGASFHRDTALYPRHHLASLVCVRVSRNCPAAAAAQICHVGSR